MPKFDDRVIYVGLNKSGKTYLADAVTKDHKRIVWDPNFRDPDSHKFIGRQTAIWDVQSTGPDEFEEFAAYVMKNRNCQVVIDEAPNAIPVYYRINPKKYPETAELLTRCRHRGHAIHIITLRPTSIPPTIWDLAYRYCIFESHGENTTKRLNNTMEGMGDAAMVLEKYHYIECDGRSYNICPPV